MVGIPASQRLARCCLKSGPRRREPRMTNGSPGGRGHNHLFTASQYGLSHFFMLSLYCCLLALYKNSCQYQVAAEKSETPAGKGAGLFHWWRERGGLRAHRWKKRVRRASAMLAHWGIEVFLGHCDPRKELTGMILGNHYHYHLMLVWPHFHRSRLCNSRVFQE